jgi:penicillin amidase
VARHISDLADPDANLFALLGGQDGWFGSSTFDDQVVLWRQSQYVTVPLNPETARARAAHHMTITPGTRT